MYVMLSWVQGQKPRLDLLPVGDVVGVVRMIFEAGREGREIELYLASDSELTLVYPDAESAVVTAADLVAKEVAKEGTL